MYVCIDRLKLHPFNYVEINNPKQVIPNEFVKTHMHMMKGRDAATLFVGQDKWNVKLTLNKQSGLTCGWSEFRE